MNIGKLVGSGMFFLGAIGLALTGLLGLSIVQGLPYEISFSRVAIALVIFLSFWGSIDLLSIGSKLFTEYWDSKRES